VCPVQARREDGFVIIQSVVPSRCRMEKVVVGEEVDRRAVTGVVEVIR
jgi:hypothetical protein